MKYQKSRILEAGCDNFFQDWMFDEGTWLEMQRDQQFDQFHDHMAFGMAYQEGANLGPGGMKKVTRSL